MEFPIRCFTCTTVIGNKYERYTELMVSSFARVKEWANANSTRNRAFHKHVVSKRKPGDTSRLTSFEVLQLLNVKRYCCRSLFLTYVDIPLPDPDYLERTFPRVKFLNKRHGDEDKRQREHVDLGETTHKLKKKSILAR